MEYKLLEAHFNIFKKECVKWIEKFKLDNWEVHYRWQEKESARASIDINLDGYIATINLNREWDSYEGVEELKQCAKHEVVHLLLGRFSVNANARFVSENDLSESEEELVRKLDKLL